MGGGHRTRLGPRVGLLAMDAYRQWLTEQKTAIEQIERTARGKEVRWSLGRLGVFAAGVIAVAVAMNGSAWAGLFTLGVAAVAFIATMRTHQRVLGVWDLAQRRLQVIGESLRRAGGAVVNLRDTSRPADPEIPVTPVGAMEQGKRWGLSDQECDDLDLYAQPTGLFGLLNRTATQLGVARLRDWLEQPSMDIATLQARQQAVQWFSEQDEARRDMAAALINVRAQDRSMRFFHEALHEARILIRGPLLWLARGWSAFCLLLTGFAIYQVVAGDLRWISGLSVAMLVNVVVLGSTWGQIRRHLQQWEAALDFATGYRQVAEQAVATLPRTVAPLETLRTVLEQVAHPQALPAVVKWTGRSAGGGWIQLLINVLALWDLHMHTLIVRHAVPARAALLGGLDAMAQIEVVVSLGCFAREQPQVTFPQLVTTPDAQSDAVLEIEAVVHPLIDPARVVGNDITLKSGAGQNLWLITGSNMSGKSTFLRAVGVCALLAQIGSAVPARAMRCALLRLITDLRVRDDIGKGESYFLAEVRHLRRMLAAEVSQPFAVLGLVDEPFRGTNHQEQHAATLAIVEHLHRAAGLFILATHDRELARAAEAGGICNRHFQEELRDGQLIFDYRLRTGVAHTRNAIRVLEREGYPPQIIARAHAIVSGVSASE